MQNFSVSRLRKGERMRPPASLGGIDAYKKLNLEIEGGPVLFRSTERR